MDLADLYDMTNESDNVSNCFAGSATQSIKLGKYCNGFEFFS